MNLDRRRLVTVVAAGLRLATLGTLARAQDLRSGDLPSHDHCERHGPPDRVLEHLAREIGAVDTRARTRGFITGEDMRTLAGHLRTIAVYIESNDVDSIFRQRTRDVLRERGRTALFEWKPDVERLRAEVAVYGITLDRRFLELFDA